MEIENKLTNEQILKLKDIKNPSLTKIIKLSQELNVDIKILLEYFIDRISSEMEEENKNIKKGD